MSQQGLRQASVRAVSGTTLNYEGDWHAMWDLQGIAAGPFNGRMLQYINLKLGTSYTEINGAMYALAAANGASNFSSLGTFNASVSEAFTLLSNYGGYGVATVASDDTMAIVDSGTPANNYQGTFGAKVTTARALETTYWGSDGLLKVAGAGVSVRDYDPRLLAVTGGTPGYRGEEQRINLATQSRDQSSADYSKNACTVTANAAVSADGTTAMDKIVENSSTATHFISQTIAVTSGTIYTQSALVKAGERTEFCFWGADAFAANQIVRFTLSGAGVATVDEGAATGRIANMGNGIYLCEMTCTPNATTNATFRTLMYNGSTNYLGDGASGFYIDEFQVEAGPFASSRIRTTTGAVTRPTDLPTLAGTLFPLNVTEGSLFADWVMLGTGANAQYAISLDNGTTTELIALLRKNTRVANMNVVDNSGGVVNLDSVATIANFTRSKQFARYKLNDCAVAQAGEAVQTNTFCTMPTPTQIVFCNNGAGNRSLNGWLLAGLCIPTGLSDAALLAGVA